ncbi:MAG TPA: serine/threonine-protein kinase [Gemmatimonadales bacterium]|nr:serine/threonine-protein kinase [Gemmatimonadales bacterium]
MPYCPECSASVPPGVDACPTCGASLVPTPTGGGASQPAARSPVNTEEVADDLGLALGEGYQYLRLVGVGGMGAVFLFREVALKRLVAVKVLAPDLAADAGARARFTREARSAAALSHPNVVRVYAVGETDGLHLPYIVMQYVEGPSLAQWMEEHRRASERDGRRIIGEVAAGLAAAHARGFLHRDVKPANVLLEAETGRAYVADFGVSAALARTSPEATGSLTATGHVVGTPIYMSPEQAAGEPLTDKSDVYSLGVMAYELLVGELPFKATTAMGWAAAHLRDTPTPVSRRRADLSPEVSRLVDRCVAKHPMDRPTAGDVERGMTPTLTSEIEWPPPGMHWLHGRSRVLSRLALATFAGAVLTLSAITFTPQLLQAHANWLWTFQNPSGRDPVAVSLFLWQTQLILGVSVLALSLFAFLALGTGAARRLVRLRGAGWRWSTLADVAADHDRRSGLVLSGAREFASLEPARRRAILMARRWRSAALLAAVLWTLAAVGVWGALLLVGSLQALPVVPVVGFGLWLTALGPPLLGVAIVAGAWLRERGLLGPLARTRRGLRDRDSDAADWYASLSVAVQPAGPAAHGLRRWAWSGQLLAALLALVVVVAIGEAVAASVTAVLATQRLGPRTVALVNYQKDILNDDPIEAARPAWAPVLPRPDAVADSVVRGWIRSLADAGGPALPPYRPRPSTLLHGSSALLDALHAAGRDSLAAGLRDSLALLAAQPRTQLFRRVARAPLAATPMAGPNSPFAAADSGDPRPSVIQLQEAAIANTAGAILSVARHDLAGAAARIGETAAFAEQLLRAPDVRANALGMRMLRDLVVQPLIAVQKLGARGLDAEVLRDASQRLDEPLPDVAGAAGLTVNPRDNIQFTAAVQNQHVPPGYRMEYLVEGWAGLCANPWEVLTGPSAARKQAMLAAADVMTDVPHARALVAYGAGVWELGADQLTATGLRHSLVERGPWGVLQRVRMCSSTLY